MLVRLAFSLMLQADADVLLIDEVLAVGDASFQQKCADAFRRDESAKARRSSSSPTRWRRSRTYCHRAMLISDGKIQADRRPGRGRPASTCGSTSTKRSSEETGDDPSPDRCRDDRRRAARSTPGSGDEDGERVDQRRARQADPLRAEIEVLQRRLRPGVGFMIANAEGLGMFEFGGPVDRGRQPRAEQRAAGAGRHEAGEPARARPLLRPLRRPPPGARRREHRHVHRERLDFIVYGRPARRALARARIEFVVDGEKRAR